jgi:SNF2 family DNA or RNA helicase
LNGDGWAPLPADVFARCGPQIAALLAAADAAGGAVPRALGPEALALARALDVPPPAEFAALRPLIDGFTALPPAPEPADLTATLRDYQRLGVAWLRFLGDAGLGAVLADDMGLGKTLQTMCALERPALVVCPTSVLPNWKAELEKFRPGLRVSSYHGRERGIDPAADVTLTTYALLRIDREPLAAVEWATVVLDEAQAIKNPESQAAAAAFGLRAARRVALSGTPVENRLEELWSLLHFTNPGVLGGRREFDERYARPIAQGDEAAAARLRARIKPFVLRRTKREVAPELPPRTDLVVRCELDAEERATYDAVRAATRQEVVERLREGGGVLAALEALLRLRQAACHRGLLPGGASGGVTRSSKVDRLLEQLDESIAEGHKALVFSQWTGLLDLVEPDLHRRGLAFARLDGSTRDRGAVVARFQAEDGPPVLLISLKAGGTGLNLTAADHVFLLDPWWNPAAEDQAADRAHRIGQDRPVFVHRLVASDTVEDRMLALQARKRELAAVALSEGAAAGAITRDDLLALLDAG